MTELPLYRSHVAGLLDNVTSHGMTGAVRSLAFNVCNLANIIPNLIDDFYR